MASTIESLTDQAPTFGLELTRNGLDTVLKYLINTTEGLKEADFGFTEGKKILIEEVLSQSLDPVISILTSLQPDLYTAKRVDSKIKLIPDEFIVFFKGIQKSASDGTASPLEFVLAGVLKDMKIFLKSMITPSEKKIDLTYISF